MHQQLIECVPNISAGCDTAKTITIEHIIGTVENLKLLDIDIGEANKSKI